MQVLIVSVIYFSPESQHNLSLFNKLVSELCHGFVGQRKVPWVTCCFKRYINSCEFLFWQACHLINSTVDWKTKRQQQNLKIRILYTAVLRCSF